MRNPLLIVLVLLVLAVPTVRGLDADALWYDEIRSYQHAGGAQYGPKALPQVWQALASNAPDQAPGYFLLLNLWGAAVGWSEFAVRALSLLAALLCVAVVYRAGRDLFGVWGGFGAAVILATSAYFVQFGHEARAFMLGMLTLALVMWGYWRLMYIKPDRVSMAALVIGALGMVYAHYFIAVLLLVLAAYHIVSGPKTRRWWLPVLLALPVIVAFIPAGLMLDDGIARNEANARLDALAMTAPQVGWALLRFFGNGAGIAALALLVVGAVSATRRENQAQRYVLFMALGGVVAVMAVNAQMGLIIPGRERYLAGLWVPLALLAGAGVAWMAQQQKPLALAVLGVWAVMGLWATANGQIVFVGEARELAWRDLQATLDINLSPADVVAFHAPKYPWGTKVPFDHYLTDLPVRAELLESLETDEVMAAYANGAARVWLAVDHRYPAEPQLATFEAAVTDNHTRCEEWALDDLTTLALYARLCPDDTPAATFGGVQLVSATEPTIENGLVTATTHWRISADVPPETYSVGLHLLDESGELVAQQDVGLPRLPVLVLDTALTVDAPGAYTLTAIVYNWQTGERLSTPQANGSDPARYTLGDVQIR